MSLRQLHNTKDRGQLNSRFRYFTFCLRWADCIAFVDQVALVFIAWVYYLTGSQRNIPRGFHSKRSGEHIKLNRKDYV